MKIQKTEYVTLDAGTYTATVASVVPAEGQFGPQLEWQFQIEDGTTFKSWCSQSLSPKSKLYSWARALLGGEVPETLDTDDLIGKPCRISLLLRPRDDGTEYNKVDAVLAPKPGQKARPMPEPEAVEEIPF